MGGRGLGELRERGLVRMGPGRWPAHMASYCTCDSRTWTSSSCTRALRLPGDAWRTRKTMKSSTRYTSTACTTSLAAKIRAGSSSITSAYQMAAACTSSSSNRRSRRVRLLRWRAARRRRSLITHASTSPGPAMLGWRTALLDAAGCMATTVSTVSHTGTGRSAKMKSDLEHRREPGPPGESPLSTNNSSGATVTRLLKLHIPATIQGSGWPSLSRVVVVIDD